MKLYARTPSFKSTSLWNTESEKNSSVASEKSRTETVSDHKTNQIHLCSRELNFGESHTTRDSVDFSKINDLLGRFDRSKLSKVLKFIPGKPM